MFPDISLVWIMAPAMLAVFAFGRIYTIKTRVSTNSWANVLSTMRVSVIQLAIILAILWLCLPHTSRLSTFGYPNDIESVNTKEKILDYLQQYNKAIVRTTEVLYWAIFFVAITILNTAFILLTVYKSKFDNQR